MSYRIFIAGFSGAGKTTTGNFLEEEYHWKHIDVEKLYAKRRTQFDRLVSKTDAWLDKNVQESEPTVITWGYVKKYGPTAKRIVEYGFIPVWFMGRSELLRQNRIKRGDKKITKREDSPIEVTLARTQVEGWNVIDVFRMDGSMFSSEELSQSIIAIARRAK